MIDVWWSGFVGGFLWGVVIALCLLVVAGVVKGWRRK